MISLVVNFACYFFFCIISYYSYSHINSLSYIDTKVDILLNVYNKEQPKLGCLGSYSLYNYSEGRKKIIFDLDIPKETYAYIDKARSGNDELEFFAQVEAPKQDEVEYVVPVGSKPDIKGKVYKSVFTSLHSFGKK